MFNNPGAKLKGVVKTVTVVGMIFSILSGVGIWIIFANFNGFAAFLVGAVIAVIGCLIWWLLNLAVLTFADIADNVWRIERKLSGNDNVGTAVSAKTASVSVVMPRTKRVGVKAEDYPHDKNTEWVCSSCMKVNRLGDKYCSCGCGVALSEE